MLAVDVHMRREQGNGLPKQSIFYVTGPMLQEGARSAQKFAQREGRQFIWTFAVAAVALLASSITSAAAELNSETLAAWNQYIQTQNARVAETARSGSFLWSDQSPDRIPRLRDGEVLVASIGDNPKAVPHGLIHHWIGAVFLADMSLDGVLAVVRDYDKYERFYAPNVVDSTLEHEDGADDAFSLRMLNKTLVAKFALDAEFQTTYTRLGTTRCYSLANSTRIREVDGYGQTDQHELPPDTGRGFIWRLYNIARFEQRNGGVYVEMETVALSRDVPAGLRWLVDPAIRRASKSSIAVSLKKTQEAVLESNQLASRTATNDQSDQKESAPATALAAKVGNKSTPLNTFSQGHNK